MRIYPFVLIAITLTSCATPEEQALERAQYAQGLRQRCYAYGFKPGEQGTANCVMQLDAMARQQRAADDAATTGMALQMLGSNQPSQPMRATGGFSCWRIGDSLQCR